MAQVDRDLVECPVCFEIPDGVIYQCREGHSICDTCSTGLALCPQSREPLDDYKIRNRAMEALVAGMTVGCKYEEDGCAARMPRKDLTGHQDTCAFRPVNICKVLGFPHCDFVCRPGRTNNIVYRHLLNEHCRQLNLAYNACKNVGGWLSSYQQVVSAVLNRSLESMKTSLRRNQSHMTYLAFTTNTSDTNVQVFYNSGSGPSFPELKKLLDLIDLKGAFTAGFNRAMKGPEVVPKKILVCFHANANAKQGGDFSVICLHFEVEEDPGIELTVEISASKKNIRWSWSGRPTHYMKAEYAVSNPLLKIPIRYLLDVLDGDHGGEEEVKCKIYY